MQNAGALKLHPRETRHPSPEAAYEGRLLNAAEFAREIAGERFSPRWIIERFQHAGFRPGREWLWYESAARAAWAEYVERVSRRRA